jgi:hypothetical protein
MGLRTYLPTIYVTLSFLCSYIAKHRDVMLKFVGEENAGLFDDVVIACHALTAVIRPFVQPNP